MNASNKNNSGTRPAAGSGSGSPSPAAKPPQSSATPAKPSTKPARKRIPKWLRVILRIIRVLLVPFLCIAALIGGVMFGYGYMGGRAYSDVWSMETWKHLFELVFAN